MFNQFMQQHHNFMQQSTQQHDNFMRDSQQRHDQFVRESQQNHRSFQMAQDEEPLFDEAEFDREFERISRECDAARAAHGVDDDESFEDYKARIDAFDIYAR